MLKQAVKTKDSLYSTLLNVPVDFTTISRLGPLLHRYISDLSQSIPALRDLYPMSPQVMEIVNVYYTGILDRNVPRDVVHSPGQTREYNDKGVGVYVLVDHRHPFTIHSTTSNAQSLFHSSTPLPGQQISLYIPSPIIHYHDGYIWEYLSRDNRDDRRVKDKDGITSAMIDGNGHMHSVQVHPHVDYRLSGEIYVSALIIPVDSSRGCIYTDPRGRILGGGEGIDKIIQGIEPGQIIYSVLPSLIKAYYPEDTERILHSKNLDYNTIEYHIDHCNVEGLSFDAHKQGSLENTLESLYANDKRLCAAIRHSCSGLFDKISSRMDLSKFLRAVMAVDIPRDGNGLGIEGSINQCTLRVNPIRSNRKEARIVIIDVTLTEKLSSSNRRILEVLHTHGRMPIATLLCLDLSQLILLSKLMSLSLSHKLLSTASAKSSSKSVSPANHQYQQKTSLLTPKTDLFETKDRSLFKLRVTHSLAGAHDSPSHQLSLPQENLALTHRSSGDGDNTSVYSAELEQPISEVVSPEVAKHIASIKASVQKDPLLTTIDGVLEIIMDRLIAQESIDQDNKLFAQTSLLHPIIKEEIKGKDDDRRQNEHSDPQLKVIKSNKNIHRENKDEKHNELLHNIDKSINSSNAKTTISEQAIARKIRMDIEKSWSMKKKIMAWEILLIIGMILASVFKVVIENMHYNSVMSTYNTNLRILLLNHVLRPFGVFYKDSAKQRLVLSLPLSPALTDRHANFTSLLYTYYRSRLQLWYPNLTLTYASQHTLLDLGIPAGSSLLTQSL